MKKAFQIFMGAYANDLKGWSLEDLADMQSFIEQFLIEKYENETLEKDSKMIEFNEMRLNAIHKEMKRRKTG